MSIVIEDGRILQNGGDGAMFAAVRGRVSVVGTEIAGNAGSGVNSFFAEPGLYAHNFVHDNASHGILTDISTSRFLYNVANRNGRSGILVLDDFDRFFPYLFTGNVANGNREWGIAFFKRGVIGDVDGGGNTARGNGIHAQCFNITCAQSRSAVRTETAAPGDPSHSSP